MSFFSDYKKYCAAIQSSEKASESMHEFLNKLGIDEYGVTFCKGDGVMIYREHLAVCATISPAQVLELSRCIKKEDAMKILDSLDFFC